MTEQLPKDKVEYRDPTAFPSDKLQSISVISDGIRHKMFGEDTREAMAQQGEALVKLMQESGGNQSAEVIAARGNFGILGMRENAQDKKIENVALLADSKGCKEDILTYLSQINSVPETVANAAELTTKYPTGKAGLFIAADNGHKYIWTTKWLDAGVYQAEGIADGTIVNPMIADSTIAGEKLDPEYATGLVKSQKQTDMNLSIKTFTRSVSATVNGYIYIQAEPIYGKGKLTISVVSSKTGTQDFFTFKKTDKGMQITGKMTASVTPGLNTFESTLVANGGVTYYGTQAKGGTPMQRVARYYPAAMASTTIVSDIAVGSVIVVNPLTTTTETEGFFATINGMFDADETNQNVKIAKKFIDSVAVNTVDQGSSLSVQQSSSHTVGKSINDIDPDTFSFWGVRLAPKNKTFNGYSVKVKLKKLEYKSKSYRFCAIVENIKTLKRSTTFTNINPNVDYAEAQTMFFQFDESFNLNDDLYIGISIVDEYGYIQSVDSTGAMITDAYDSNLFNDGTAKPWHSVIYGAKPKDNTTIHELSIGGINTEDNPKFYTGLDYELFYGQFKESYKINDPSVNERLDKFEKELVKYDQQPPVFNTLKFRSATGNFEKSPNVCFIGRWFDTDGGVMTINQGAEVAASFVGSSISAKINALATLPCLAVSIDGAAFNRVKMKANGVVELANGLTNSKHYIRLIMDGVDEHDDLWLGQKGIVFEKFIVNSDEDILTTPIKPFNKVGWFIGDSITAGINVLGNGANPTVNSATQAYDFICSNILNLTNIRVAFGATGLTRGGSGGVPKADSYLDEIVDGIEDTISDYPDVIFINHGTNDSSATAADYITAYRAFLNRVSIKFPGTPIVVIAPFNHVFKDSFNAIIDGFNNVRFVDTYEWNIIGGNTGHPDAANSLTAGNKLADTVFELFGYSFFN